MVTVFDPQGIFTALKDHAMSSALFERVNGHEPKNAPGLGLNAAVWANRILPVPMRSGLSVVSILCVMNVQIYSSMMQEPQDFIDPNIMNAVGALMAAYAGDFTLGNLIDNVDIFGAYGYQFGAQAGYLDADNRKYRIMTIMLPLVINDVWNEAP